MKNSPMPPPAPVRKGRHALVLGGGIAGLATAGVLCRHFEEVTVVDRDPYPDKPAVRPHAPQGAHVHILLAGGLHTLTRLVPELPGWLDEMGLAEGDLTEHVRLAHGGRWLPKIRSGVPIRPCTRPVLEHLLHRDVKRRPNVSILSDRKALGLTGAGTARGLSIAHDAREETLHADLIVDTAGRSSPSAKWLASAGAGRVEEEIVDGGVVYSSCSFQTAGTIDDDWMLLGNASRVPDEPRLSAVMRVAPDRLLCAVIAYGNPTPPRSPAEFVERMGELPVKEPHLLLRDAKPVSGVSSYSGTQNRFRHYGKLQSPVDRFVIMGDALCALNPRYGQGMTVAALGAERLDRELDAYWAKHRRLDGFAIQFQKQMEDVLKVPWQMALMEDKLWVSALSGKKPGLLDRIAAKGTERILNGVFANMHAYIRFMRVAHMLDSPAKLMTPAFIGAVIRGGARDAPAEGPGIGLRPAT